MWGCSAEGDMCDVIYIQPVSQPHKNRAEPMRYQITTSVRAGQSHSAASANGRPDTLLRRLMSFLLAVVMMASYADQAIGAVAWDADRGVIWDHPSAGMQVRLPSPVFRVLPGTDEYRPTDPDVQQVSRDALQLQYQLALPGGPQLVIKRDIVETPQGSGTGLVETLTICPSQPWTSDVEIERPFTVQAVHADGDGRVICPLKNGWARELPLTGTKVEAEYQLGHTLTGPDTPHLALPVVHAHAGPLGLAVMTDVTFSSLFALQDSGSELTGAVRYRYLGSRVPIQGTEVRTLGFSTPSGAPAGRAFDQSLDAFFSLMLPDVPAGPDWLHEIAMVDYDFLSDNGQGWEHDVELLAQWLKPEQRKRVALCLHGWYDALGAYCFDAQTKQLKNEWVAFGLTRKVELTQDELRRRMQLARSFGFRVLLYFGDGLAADSGVPGYRDDWAYRSPDGKPIAGWQGPDTYGSTYLRNPAHPEVYQWYLDYCDALLKSYGAEFDGLVWDETFHAALGQIALEPVPAYCDRTFMMLVKQLAQRVHAFDPQKVFLASDCVGVPGMEHVPGYGMVAHGTYQDSWCHPVAWSYGLFANWRNVLWSCNWSPIGNFHYTRFGVQTFGVPVAITNGWGDDCGPSEWQPSQRDRILALFAERCARTERVRYLTTDPAQLMAAAPHVAAPGDPLPAPDPNLTNWALAKEGGKASASSEFGPTWAASGLIDGVRDDSGWGAGHGWASAAGAALPQWVQVEFLQPKRISRFVVITYEKEGTSETAGKWGVQDYEIQVWDAARGQWNTVATENKSRAVKTRVHDLPAPVETSKFRLVVQRVAPLDGQARLLQLEAWGAAN